MTEVERTPVAVAQDIVTRVDCGRATTTSTSQSAPISSPLTIFNMSTASSCKTTRPTHSRSSSATHDPASPTRSRAFEIAALPSFSHSLSDFAQMAVVPGELLSGCMRTGTGAVAREKLENVLAANNKVLAPYNSSSEDEFSSYSSDSHYPTIRRRAMRTIGVMTPIASTHVSLKVKKTVTNVATAETDAIPFGPLSSASSGTASLPSPSPGLSSRTSTSLTINAHTANALLQSQPKPQPNVYTKVDNEPTTAIEPRTLAQHKPPQTPDTPYSGYYGSSETDSSPGCVHTPASLSRAAYFQADETAVLEGTSGGGGLASQSGTIRARRRATGPGSRSASRNRTPKRSPEREKSHTSPTQTMREREAALFKVALERTQGRRGGTLARSRPRAKAMFDLSSESDSSEE